MTIELWELIKIIFIPGGCIAIGFLYREHRSLVDDCQKKREGMYDRINLQAAEINGLRLQISAAALEYERRYVNQDHLDDFKRELFKRLDRFEDVLDGVTGVKQKEKP